MKVPYQTNVKNSVWLINLSIPIFVSFKKMSRISSRVTYWRIANSSVPRVPEMKYFLACAQKAWAHIFWRISSNHCCIYHPKIDACLLIYLLIVFFFPAEIHPSSVLYTWYLLLMDCRRFYCIFSCITLINMILTADLSCRYNECPKNYDEECRNIIWVCWRRYLMWALHKVLKYIFSILLKVTIANIK